MLFDLKQVKIVSIEESREDEVYDISNYQDDCFEEEGNFLCNDVVVHNCLPQFKENRDDPKQKWKIGEHPRIIEILEHTNGLLVYQEDMTRLWIGLAGFTVPEAEAARKIISKKWRDKLPIIEKQWIEGATKTIGEEHAKAWWEKQVSFGRYCFNQAHALAYSIVTFQCLYLKTHFPQEWWAAVMSECHFDKMQNYMSAARMDGVKFGTIDINSITLDFAVKGDEIIPGLTAIKGIGEVASNDLIKCIKDRNGKEYKNIDEVVLDLGKNKNVFERLIKLGAFDKLHHNRAGLWKWYQYEYGSGTDITVMRNKIKESFLNEMWPESKRTQELERQKSEFKKLYPNKKFPPKILNWKPKVDKDHVVNRDFIIESVNDYTLEEKLKIEKEFLDYYWGSPLSLYQITEGTSIEDAKTSGLMQVVVESLVERVAKKTGNKFYVLRLTDGIQYTDVFIWNDTYRHTDKRYFVQGVGIQIPVVYSNERKSFKISTGGSIIHLRKINNNVEIPVVESVIPEVLEVLW